MKTHFPKICRVISICMFIVLVITRISLSDEQVQEIQKSLTYFEPPYYGNYTLSDRVNSFQGFNLKFFSRDNPFKHEKCKPLAEIQENEHKYIVCTASWAGSNLDLWVIVSNQDGNTARIYFSNKKLSNLVKKLKYHYDGPNAIFFENIISIHTGDIQLKDGIIRINIMYSTTEQPSETKELIEINLEDITRDSDEDNLNDFFEERIGTNKNNNDTDHDGIIDVFDTNPVFSKTGSECEPFNIIFKNGSSFSDNQVIVVKYSGKEHCQLSTNRQLVLHKLNNEFNDIWFLRFGRQKMKSDGTIDIKFFNRCSASLCAQESIYKFKFENNVWKLIKAKELWTS